MEFDLASRLSSILVASSLESRPASATVVSKTPPGNHQQTSLPDLDFLTLARPLQSISLYAHRTSPDPFEFPNIYLSYLPFFCSSSFPPTTQSSTNLPPNPALPYSFDNNLQLSAGKMALQASSEQAVKDGAFLLELMRDTPHPFMVSRTCACPTSIQQRPHLHK
jgi:hypothetical protein